MSSTENALQKSTPAFAVIIKPTHGKVKTQASRTYLRDGQRSLASECNWALALLASKNINKISSAPIN